LAYYRRSYPISRRRSPFSRLLEYAVAAAFLIAVSVLAAALAKISAETLSGNAVAVDGDSLLIGETRVRLEGIDAPELMQTCASGGKTFECGREARNHLRRLIGGRPVSCSGWQTDKFGRTLARCTVPGSDLNAGMVRDGWAVAFGDFEFEEAQARAQGRGLWKGEFETPREWRRKHAETMEEGSPHSASVGDFISAIGRRLYQWAGY
jgi:endonuclease YncB( thermonuclease family)